MNNHRQTKGKLSELAGCLEVTKALLSEGKLREGVPETKTRHSIIDLTADEAAHKDVEMADVLDKTHISASTTHPDYKFANFFRGAGGVSVGADVVHALNCHITTVNKTFSPAYAVTGKEYDATEATLVSIPDGPAPTSEDRKLCHAEADLIEARKSIDEKQMEIFHLNESLTELQQTKVSPSELKESHDHAVKSLASREKELQQTKISLLCTKESRDRAIKSLASREQELRRAEEDLNDALHSLTETTRELDEHREAYAQGEEEHLEGLIALIKSTIKMRKQDIERAKKCVNTQATDMSILLEQMSCVIPPGQDRDEMIARLCKLSCSIEDYGLRCIDRWTEQSKDAKARVKELEQELEEIKQSDDFESCEADD
ncbi:hypothetical protein AUEXF2481DRAFT_1400 [Aureobasidium subglaciale EXF-2481]|uniref:Uncharacterized protein n=1 Tax=Aureobasidium subglaciale (strain EXF-2481) TaxID=1043005 RepID=A0A074YUT9_AURSE|nr:uncharacterized protein AUEXF2481DRAFT_1400 [Aureobasidium subglaciale EXF-2481]KEQ99934.1 hypothetical protein AUEXF2481DRAFT_1400 [Aureobasidium subglaciale EXF-2481]